MAADFANSVTRALVGQRCLGIRSIETLADGDDRVGRWVGIVSMRWTGLQDLALCRYLQVMNCYVEAGRQPAEQQPAALSIAADMRTKCLGRASSLEDSIIGDPRDYLLKELRCSVQRRLATTALALERFRITTGRLPEGLDELVPDYLEAIPVDPFDGTLIRFFHLARGYMIYSVGEDGYDDGGCEVFMPVGGQGSWTNRLKPDYVGTTPSRKLTTDITFTVER